MNITQLFLAVAGLNITVFLALAGFIKYYLDAKVDPIAKGVDKLIDYLILHEGKIARLEERTKHLG